MLDLKKLVEKIRRSVSTKRHMGSWTLVDPVDDEEVEELRVHELGLASTTDNAI
jgi:hypothetical protein